MTGERQCPDDLVARAQRRDLSDLERQVLKAHLDTCGPCRAASAVAMLFDTIPASQPGDDQLVARVMAKTTRARRRSGRHGLRAAAIMALVVLTSGAAVGAWLAHRAAERPATAPSPPAPPSSPSSRASRPRPPSVSRLTAAAEPPVADETSAPVADPPRQTIDGERRRPAAARAAEAAPILANEPASPAAPTPTALFAQANAVRRAGEVHRAISLYQALRQRFPDSEEARLSAISQGDLLLGQGEAAAAIASYAAYLRAAPQGSLTEEALFGKARGLGQLGRVHEERKIWEELARRFPRSAYHPAAQRRLRELAP